MAQKQSRPASAIQKVDPVWAKIRAEAEDVVRHEPEIEAKLERMAGHTPKSLGESFGVTVGAAGTDLRAPAHGVPGCIRPLDL